MTIEKQQNTGQHTSPENESGMILSSGPIEATPNTEIISVNFLNVDDDQTRDIIVEIKDWTTCPSQELGKFVFLCGEEIDPSDIGYGNEDSESGHFDPTIIPSEILDLLPPITGPLFFRIPAQMQLTVLSAFPQASILSSNPCYEVRIFLTNPVNVLVSSYGLNEEFEPQEGNTVLNHQFYPPYPLSIKFPSNPTLKG